MRFVEACWEMLHIGSEQVQLRKELAELSTRWVPLGEKVRTLKEDALEGDSRVTGIELYNCIQLLLATKQKNRCSTKFALPPSCVS